MFEIVIVALLVGMMLNNTKHETFGEQWVREAQHEQRRPRRHKGSAIVGVLGIVFWLFLLLSVAHLLFIGPARAQVAPTEEQKIQALWRAYQLNGNSMTRWGSIDLSGDFPNSRPVKTVPITAPPKPKGRDNPSTK